MSFKVFVAVSMAIVSYETASAEKKICETCIPSVRGDVVHRDGTVGHAGIMAGINPQSGKILIADFTVGRDDFGRAMRYAFWEDFLEGNANWGGKRLKSTPGGLEVSAPDKWSKMKIRIADIKKAPTRYDGNHINQKGEWFPSKDFLPEFNGYWEFDCVGFTERMYEDAGLDIIPSTDEGLILKLTVQAQRDAASLMNSQ